MPITIENRRDFVFNVTKLSLWLADKYCNNGLSFDKALTQATPVYRFTTLWDGTNHPANGYADKKWNNILNKLNNLRLQNKDIENFETEGLKLLLPYLEPRCSIDVKAWPWIPSAFGTTVIEQRVYGMFLYELTEDNKLNLHMGNIFAPKSPFENPKLLKEDFRKLLEDVLRKEKNVKQIVCESWMNNFKPFLLLFPKEWFNNSLETNMKNYTYDVWGQMMNRFGGYNKPNGDYLRKNGKFPYPSIKCESSIKSILAYLHIKK